jgi:hypothetical protein
MKTKPTHTKGPWSLIPHYEPNQFMVVAGNYPDATPVCSIDSAGETRQANAAIIAAAPELLQALERVLSSIPLSIQSVTLNYDLCDARHAIKKAKGEL